MKLSTSTRMILIALALAGCSSQPTKGSNTKGADAKGAGQKSGSTATSNTSMASSNGDNYEDVACDDSEEGVAWCDDDSTIVYCSGGTWWSLDCSAIDDDFCAESDDTVDCYAI